jgi:8-oxo-dGTP pyrophosphatase MutT (NUDIX family)
MTLAALLKAHVPSDAKEAEDLLRLRAFASSLEEPFSRAQTPAHFTGSAVVVDPTGTRVVLLFHGKLKRWLQPGGHAEPMDLGDLAATALREAREETGCSVALHPTAPRPLDVDAHRIPARGEEPEHTHLDVRYLLVAEDPSALAHDPLESSGAQWLSFDEALARADEPALKRLLAKARAAAAQG